MAQILKFPTQASKLGFKRVRKRASAAENDDQLSLFPAPAAQILNLESGLSCFERALMLDERGDARAAEWYTKAIEQQDCVADAYCNLGIIESHKGATLKAFDCFTRSLTHNPRHSEAHYNLGNLYFETNDFRLAEIHFEMASQVDPAFANAYFNLALVQAINNNFAAALVALSKYQDLVPKDEGRKAEELLQNIRKSLVAVKNSRLTSN
jgi:tetratricopeptide (TPR) repeat protein